MPETVDSALWGKKDRRARCRAAAVALAAAVVALGAPAVSRADGTGGGSVPAPLLDEAKANPNATFDVIVQTKSNAADAAQATSAALTEAQTDALNNAVKAANDLTRKVGELAKKAGEAARKAAEAKQKADEAALKAARSGKDGDRREAAKKQADADRALADAQSAQAAVDAAQAEIVLAQLAIVQAQVALASVAGRAQTDIGRRFQVIPAVSATVSGSEIVGLASSDDVVAVTPDAPVQLTEENSQKWVDAVQAHWYWGSSARKSAMGLMPTIAVVDSGIDTSRFGDFGGRVLTNVDLTSGDGVNSAGDGRGHGTMVASLAAGDGEKRTGANPDARLVSLDVIDDTGTGRTSDLIAAVDWILQNRYAYNIRVVNFSLQAATPSSFMFDPLSIAVERLWLNGIVVVAAAGNYANNGAASGVLYAPASDPFVITVGAVDTHGDGDIKNDVAAPWSAWGYTRDGFLKPEISAPGRHMIGAIPNRSTLAAGGGQDPKLLGQGYLELSGTSFAAPVVSGAAAALLGIHPNWTPDQVKGALMVSANGLKSAAFGSVGVGELDLKAATSITNPPNPNAALDVFLAWTPTGPTFDSAGWTRIAKTNASWSSAFWNSASWSSASWSSASWTSASWTSAAWTSASWTSASWSSASWASAATESTITDSAAFDGPGNG